MDRLDVRDEGVRLQQNLVPWPEPGREDREQQRVGARRHSPDVLHAEVRRHLALEAAHLLATEQLHALEDALAGGEELVT